MTRSDENYEYDMWEPIQRTRKFRCPKCGATVVIAVREKLISIKKG